MQNIRVVTLILLFLFLNLAVGSGAENESEVLGPIEHVYETREGTDLKAYVFPPAKHQKGTQSAIIIFHGGGRHIGEAKWAFPVADRFASLGMVGVAVQVRLADEKKVTPIESMEDARSAVRWLRKKAEALGIHPDRIAAYGWSSGGHLAASAAVFNRGDDSDVSCSPNALILESPAVSLLADRWFRRLLLDRADVRDLSPDEHVRKDLPPTLILQGDLDTVTPLAGAERFCRRMREEGNRCDLEVYSGFGHLFTPGDIPDTGKPQPDPDVKSAVSVRIEKFLRSLEFIK